MRLDILLLGICLIASCNSASAQGMAIAPAWYTQAAPTNIVAFCDATIETRPQEAGSKTSVTKAQETDRIVIEIEGHTLYVHHREDFDNNRLCWGHLLPHDLLAVSLNRGMTGDGSWKLAMDKLWSKNSPRANSYPDATGMRLSCSFEK